jgi:hypothetical protein
MSNIWLAHEIFRYSILQSRSRQPIQPAPRNSSEVVFKIPDASPTTASHNHLFDFLHAAVKRACTLESLPQKLGPPLILKRSVVVRAIPSIAVFHCNSPPQSYFYLQPDPRPSSSRPTWPTSLIIKPERLMPRQLHLLSPNHLAKLLHQLCRGWKNTGQ